MKQVLLASWRCYTLACSNQPTVVEKPAHPRRVACCLLQSQHFTAATKLDQFLAKFQKPLNDEDITVITVLFLQHFPCCTTSNRSGLFTLLVSREPLSFDSFETTGICFGAASGPALYSGSHVFCLAFPQTPPLPVPP